MLKIEGRLELLWRVSAKQETPCPGTGRSSFLWIKPEQVKASFRGGIQEVRLPKLVVVNAQRVTVE